MLTQDSVHIQHHELNFETTGCLEFLDCTEAIEELLVRSGIRHGFLNIQSKHTTIAVLINENEPLLLQDMKRTLERLAPQTETYLHNDFEIRTVNLQEKEDQNGHSHCKAIFLPTSQMINITNNRLNLGKWQRILLLELDHSKKRTLSITLLGLS